jgi:hypothetical protein
MFEYKNLLSAFEHIHKKTIASPSRFIGLDSISIKELYFSKEQYVKNLSFLVKDQTYELKPLRKIVLNQKKKRYVYNLPLNELILHTSAAQFLQFHLERRFSDNLFSYRKGRNPFQALRKAENFLSTYKKNYKGDLKDRGLFLIKKDITNFTDSISSKPESKLYELIDQLNLAQNDVQLLKQLINPQYFWDGELLILEYLPTGSPLATILGNFFLNELDHMCSSFPESLYMRFGDDILFISPHLDSFTMVDEIITNFCQTHHLSFSPTKCKKFFLNRAGRSYDDGKVMISGGHLFDYLGYRIDFQSGIIVKPEKKKAFFQQFNHMINNYVTNMNARFGENWLNDKKIFQHFINQVNSLFDRSSQNHIPQLLDAIKNTSDRNEIKKIDLSIRKIISLKTKKTFNELINEFQLKSLVKIKNDLYG